MTYSLLSTKSTATVMTFVVHDSNTTVPLPSMVRVEGVLVQARDEEERDVQVDSQIIRRPAESYDALQITVVPRKTLTVTVLY
jgi:hypothetical protein